MCCSGVNSWAERCGLPQAGHELDELLRVEFDGIRRKAATFSKIFHRSERSIRTP